MVLITLAPENACFAVLDSRTKAYEYYRAGSKDTVVSANRDSKKPKVDPIPAGTVIYIGGDGKGGPTPMVGIVVDTVPQPCTVFTVQVSGVACCIKDAEDRSLKLYCRIIKGDNLNIDPDSQRVILQ